MLFWCSSIFYMIFVFFGKLHDLVQLCFPIEWNFTNLLLKKNYILFYEYMVFFCQSEIQNGHHHRTMEYNIFKWFFTETFDSKLKMFVLIWLQRYLPLKVGFLHCNSGIQEEEDTKVVIRNQTFEMPQLFITILMESHFAYRRCLTPFLVIFQLYNLW